MTINTWHQVAAVANGAPLTLSSAAEQRIRSARAIVESVVERGIRGYGINTGVGALCGVIIDRKDQQALSRNILMSHSCGVGEPLSNVQTRAIIAAQINNFALGVSGVRLETVELLCALLQHDCIPYVPAHGSVGYLTHTAPIGLVLIGQGYAFYRGEKLPGAYALKAIGRVPLTLEAKEGLSLVNGTPCSTGPASLALERLAKGLDWADAAAAMSYENLGSQRDVFAEQPLGLRRSKGIDVVGKTMRAYLDGSEMLRRQAGSRTQDPLSLRGVPQVHGAVRDVVEHLCDVVDRELASVTDNPVVVGTPSEPEVYSQAHAIGAANRFCHG